MAELQEGTQAPDFKGKDQDGNPVSLSELRGNKVVLYFYPKDDTPGCTKEACNLRDNYDKLKEAGYEVVGVSVDDENSHQKFIDKYDLPFTLIADTDQEIVEKYGVWEKQKMMGKEFMGTTRKTFVIDEEGKIEQVIDDVNTEAHTEQILG